MPNINIQATEAEERRINEFISALRTPCSAIMHPESPFNSQEFESEFRSKLLTHHCFMGSPLYMESFDSAFVAACRRAGYTVEFAPEGQRFWDIELGNRRISLKSSKAQSLRENKLHISKLTEAAWIQDCRTASTRQERTFELFNEYCNEVDSIIQLRYFKRQNKYELVEFPVRLFNPILELDRSHFSTDGPTINIPIGADPPDFTLKIDRSDAKITIANINKERCLVHGTWQL
ncbi:hypothetical protein [Desulfomicrobium baculatum]|uniref:Uncharacterized protein n=1 Tax=Desulfomicrobium baculatum (strain DSM 4028 / VKM B-1378 / X) TaxID=525897 RepID=C7LPG6_DESBD|nr:hypothetical protein [Desulfomicrobium baculatum]ACU89009.1 hypothetical protein Dbac_0892 [Desulfomicrobium baculatum DSM 4028]